MKTQKQDLGKVSLTCNGTWDAGKQYDRLCIVNDGNFASYISKKDVPIGTVLSDERFWQPIANLRDDIKIDYETFKKEWLELLASIQIKLRSARVIVANEEARNNLTWLEVAVGCEVYELDTQLTYILDSIVPIINLKSWHLVVGSLLDSEAKFQLDGTYELTAERAIADRWGYIIDEVYVSKKEVKNLVLSIVNDKLENISITIPPNSIKPEDLSQAVLDLIGSGGSVVNNPDEEDITSESLSNGTSVLKFKDRDYVEGTFNGLGEVILRKNQVGVVNLLEQVNINKPNTVYIVRYDFCLGGATITLPNNSTLKFEGGSINNGTIIGQNTKIEAGLTKIFNTDITLSGTWIADSLSPEHFGITGIDATQDTIYIQKALDCCSTINIKTVKLQNKTYQISSSLLIQSNIKLEGATSRVWNNGSATILSLAENIIGITVESTGVEINDLKITGNTTNTGISFTNRSYYFSGNRIITTGLGIGFDIQSSWTYIFNLCRIEGGTIGFKIQEGTSGTFNSCVAFSCTEYGFYVTKLNYGSFNGCGTDKCKYGFYFTDACRGVTLSSCGCENTQVGGYMVKCGARAYVTITAFSVGTIADVDCDLFIFEANCRVSLIDLNVGSLYHPTGNTLNVASGAAVALINCYLTGNNVGLENCSVISPYGNTLKYSTTVDKINTKELVTSSLATNATYTVLPTAPLNSVYLITAVTKGNSAARGFAIVTIPTDYGMASVDNLVANANCQISIDAAGNIIVTNTSSSTKAYRVSLLKLV